MSNDGPGGFHLGNIGGTWRRPRVVHRPEVDLCEFDEERFAERWRAAQTFGEDPDRYSGPHKCRVLRLLFLRPSEKTEPLTLSFRRLRQGGRLCVVQGPNYLAGRLPSYPSAWANSDITPPPGDALRVRRGPQSW